MNLSFNNMSMSWQQQGMVGMGGMNPMSGAAGMGMGINQQQFMVPPLMPGADQAYLAAHQQAMRIAKQAYQYAVAQQAMAAAADEWERGSSVSAFASPGSMSAGVGGYGMGGMHAMNGMNGMNGMWGNAGPMFTAGMRSMYAGSSIGGAASEVGWGGTASVYGETFGPSMQTSARRSQVLSGNMRSSGVVAFPGSSQRSELAVSTGPSSRNAPRPRTKTAPSNTPLPTQHRHNRGPPSSWKVGS
ncbi:hypothetical protein M0805_002422 [Coniferiporia weirii]|nr:hypothetical protein M0805_002422 [Coniferiporia weirii]